MKKEFLEIAKIINTHGIAGEMKLEPWCDSQETLKGIKHLYLGERELTVTSLRTGGAFPLIKFSGIDTVEDAAKYKNKILSARRSDIKIPDGRIFVCDLIGLDVIDKNTGRIYGTLSDVLDYEPHEIYVIKTETGEVMLPAVPEYISQIDVENGIFITPIEGFFN